MGKYSHTLSLLFLPGSMPSNALSNIFKQGFQLCTCIGVWLSEA